MSAMIDRNLPTGADALSATGSSENLKLSLFLDALWATDLSAHALFDPWNARNREDDAEAVARRRFNLAAHLSAETPRLLLVGEAPGYQGCARSGVAFTSEYLRGRGAIPRLTTLDPLHSPRGQPWREPSATIVWGAVMKHDLAEHTLLWNACCWHPHKGTPDTNRKPTQAELDLGAPHLRMLIDYLPPHILIGAVGKVAGGLLTTLGVGHSPLRHPANGGATIFRDGVGRMLSFQS